MDSRNGQQNCPLLRAQPGLLYAADPAISRPPPSVVFQRPKEAAEGDTGPHWSIAAQFMRAAALQMLKMFERSSTKIFLMQPAGDNFSLARMLRNVKVS